jgi:hypothetical protein
MELMKRECRWGAGLGRALAVAGLAASLSACGSLNIFGGSDDSDSSAPAAPPSKTKTFFENLAMGGAEQPLPPTAAPAGQTRYPDAVTQENDFQCPMLDVAANGASLRIFVGGPDAGAQALRHQIAINKVARECKDAGPTNISMKLGVEGSVLLGPSGTPGTFTVPLVFEARLKDKVVTSRRENLSVTIPANDVRAFYNTVIADFVIPKDDDVELYVGLNQGAEQPLRPPARKRRQARR